MEISYILISLESILNILKDAEVDKVDFEPSFRNRVLEFKTFIDTIFDIDISAKFKIKEISENIFKLKIYPEIDEVIKKQEIELKKLNKVAYHISNIFEKEQKNPKSKIGNYVDIKYLDSEGHSLIMTKNRFKTIEKKLKSSFIDIDGEKYFFSDFSYRILQNRVKIKSILFEEITKSFESNKVRLISLVKIRYLETLQDLDIKFSHIFDEIITFISNIDVAISNVQCIQSMNLIRPNIISEKKYFEAIGLRHPIIEANEKSGIYIPNDIFLGNRKDTKHNHITLNANENDEVNGVLLYGINSSGKSSLMKSIGLSIILAQSGFFVPAIEFNFSLYEKIFTRIISQDNLYKGLSTFSVEMLELKNIFNRSNKNSLILGDEISQGTETESGVAIVAGAILKLIKLKSNFIFATHLHQLKNIKRLEDIKSLIFLHLGVKYDEKNDILIYNRELKVGMGNSLYGLEFAKSLHMDEDFLKKCIFNQR